jgi:hypothetical protein
MLRSFVALALLVAGTGSAFAQEEEGAAPPAGTGALQNPTEAEYYRLRDKLDSLARKNHWAGAERTYQEMRLLNRELTFEDHLNGAQAARATGDITAARERLGQCHKIREDKEVIEWMASIDSEYGRVSLLSDPGKVQLDIKEMPFDPAVAASVKFAQERIVSTGSYDGLLPKGDYTFGPFDVKIRPGVDVQRIDVRTDEGIRAAEKAAARERRKARKG